MSNTPQMALPPPTRDDDIVASRLESFASLGNSLVNKAEFHVVCQKCGRTGHDGSFSAYPEQAFRARSHVVEFLREQQREFLVRKCPECGTMAPLAGIRLFIMSQYLERDLIVDLAEDDDDWRLMDLEGQIEVISDVDDRVGDACIDSCLRAGAFLSEMHPDEDSPEARDLLAYVVRERPQAFEAHLALARLLLRDEADDAARSHLALAAEHGEDDASCCHELGNLLGDAAISREDSDFLTQSVSWFRRAIRLQPDDASPHLNLGRVLVQTGNLAEGRKALRDAASVDNRFAPSANYHLGIAALREHNIKEAISIFGGLTRTAPHDADVRRMYAWALARNGDQAGALRELDQADLLEPGSEETARIRTMLFEEDGEA